MALTSKAQLFIDTFCESLDNGVQEKKAYKLAKEVAGYSDNTYRRDIITDDVAQAIQTYYNQSMVMRLAKASNKLDSLLDDPEQGGAAVLLNAVNSVFDRGGVIKKESKEVTVKAPTGIVVMPEKAPLDTE